MYDVIHSSSWLLNSKPRFDLRIIVFCTEGYTSSLAAVSLHDIGLLNSTDMIGGFVAWKIAGLPTQMFSDDIASPVM